MQRKSKWGTCQKSIVLKEDMRRGETSGRVYVREDTAMYRKEADENQKRIFDVLENTDKYKKSGIKIIKSIKIDL
jgi:hypothetical protein